MLSSSKLVSDRFKKLTTNINTIERQLLPLYPRPSGRYTKKEQSMIRAYRLLVHAELEAYFEDVAREIALRAIKNWKANRVASNVLITILSVYDVHKDNSGKSSQLETAENRVDCCFNQYMGDITRNHGIKEENLLCILIPLGLERSDFNQTWLSTMDSYGHNRGVTAHTSISGQKIINHTEEKQLIKDILAEINNLNNIISTLS